MTDNEPTQRRPDGSNQSDVTPLLDVLPGIGGPDAGRHAAARPLPVPPGADLGTDPALAEPSEEPFEGSGAGYAPAEPGAERAPAQLPEPAPDQGADTGIETGFETGTAPTGLDAVFAREGNPRDRQAPLSLPPAEMATAESVRADLDPHPPTRPGWGARVLGCLVGLVVGPAGATALLLGQSRVLAVQTDHWDADVDVFGIALVAVSALVLAGLVLLSAWTAAAPITGGAVTAAFGGWALGAPGSFADTMSIGGTWRTTVEQTIVAGTSGTLLALGLLLLAAGIAAVVVRRAGVRLGTYEGRTWAR